ncbi:glycoprotein-N-acetylgalactosamine 3-beta-galactosyltransferase 1-like [Pollicipes pollicipes]|uniref:glycoprotein-N-acetylgalactosamine 3-beta-galactosyltransferase 1-like n=1 Tax=Pollicipes pollicipes TaxID=41117 RepID=UPI0018850FF2|nr:glycoprotein-N-acetylgalactosamine 3-beta-galactosyltransferase 1-like [Pollicipes pollicipes]
MMSVLAIAPRDTRDAGGRPRFLPLPPSALYLPSARRRFQSFWRDSVYPLTEERLCCSPEAVTFGRVAWTRMYLLEYMVHHVTTDGRRRRIGGSNGTSAERSAPSDRGSGLVGPAESEASAGAAL